MNFDKKLMVAAQIKFFREKNGVKRKKERRNIYARGGKKEIP